MRWGVGFIVAVAGLAAALTGCGSSPANKAPAVEPSASALPAAGSSAPAAASGEVASPLAKPVNLEQAHAAFIRALDMDMRGLKSEADSMWIIAWKLDPQSRFLAFNVARKMMEAGADSLAYEVAVEANALPGKVLASQLEIMAKVYLYAGKADSSRKYFVAALDSTGYQDANLVYDYTLFLEAVKDVDELIRVYDILLPQTNYTQSLLNRQIGLLVENHRDTALVNLFKTAYENTGRRGFLLHLTNALLLQKRYAEVLSIADTVSTSADENSEIVRFALLTFADRRTNEDVLKFLKKKFYEDDVKTPFVAFHLGFQEYIANDYDSSRVHLEGAYPKLDKYRTEAAQACRTLAGIAAHKSEDSLAVYYAKLADSLQVGGAKDFLALVYGNVGRYDEAYALLDSMLGVWSNWKPMEAVADSATLRTMMAKAMFTYRRFQLVYADLLISQAHGIEDKFAEDTLKMAGAREARIKAELFWESMLAEDSLNMNIRLNMAKNLERLGKIQESYAMFEYLLDPARLKSLRAFEVYNYYGYTLLNLNLNPGDVEKGYALVLKALETIPDSFAPEAILDSKGWGLYKLGKYEEALETLLSIKEERFLVDDEYLEHLGAVYAALGKHADAVRTYKALLKVKPGHRAALEYLKGKKKK